MEPDFSTKAAARDLLTSRLNAPVQGGLDPSNPSHAGVISQMGGAAKLNYTQNTRHADLLGEIGREVEGRLIHAAGTADHVDVAATDWLPSPHPDDPDRQVLVQKEDDPSQGIYKGKRVALRAVRSYIPGTGMSAASAAGQRLAPASRSMSRFWSALNAHSTAHATGDAAGAMHHLTNAVTHLGDAINQMQAAGPEDVKNKVGIPAGQDEKATALRSVSGRKGAGIGSDDWATGKEKEKWLSTKGEEEGGISLAGIHDKVNTIRHAYNEHVANTIGLPEESYYDPHLVGRPISTVSRSDWAQQDEQEISKFLGTKVDDSTTRSGRQARVTTPSTKPTRDDRELIGTPRPSLIHPDATFPAKFNKDQKAKTVLQAKGTFEEAFPGKEFIGSNAHRDPVGFLASQKNMSDEDRESQNDLADNLHMLKNLGYDETHEGQDAAFAAAMADEKASHDDPHGTEGYDFISPEPTAAKARRNASFNEGRGA